MTELNKLRDFKKNFEDNIKIAIDREEKAKKKLKQIKEQLKEIKKDNKLTIDAYNDVCDERDFLRKWFLKFQKDTLRFLRSMENIKQKDGGVR